jgi:hypothetical protein
MKRSIGWWRKSAFNAGKKTGGEYRISNRGISNKEYRSKNIEAKKNL